MSKKRPPSTDLRRRAEARIAREPVRSTRDPSDAVRLVHELQVHQVELELQNEELRETRLALEGSLRRYTELFDFAPIGYVAIDVAGAIREANFAAARLLGHPRGQLAGRRFAASVAPRDVLAFDRFAGDAFTRTDEAAGARAVELSLLSGDGEVTVRITAAIVDAPIPTALLAIEDVTARRRAEDGLHEALRRRDDFLGTLSHELRNPLAPIRNGLYLLDRALLAHGPPGGEAAQRALAVIERQVAHLTRLVDDLLDVTRIARGKLQLQRHVQDVGQLMARTLDDHRAAFDAANVALQARIDPAPCWADVDATRLAQILGNLLGNALKFTPRGGRVDVSVRQQGAAVLLAVRDSGAGIEAGTLARLFEPFSQGPQTLARSAGGLGLGLATVRGLAELHGGTVEITSAGPGKGTEVKLRLPRSSPPPDRPVEPVARGKGPRRVLVIDDNHDAATSLKDVLETFGHQVVTAHDATGALQAAHTFRPEVVLCDIGLPGEDGFAVARALRADEQLRAAFLVALSGYARPEDVRRSLEAGFDRHLAKPADLERLEALFEGVPGPAAAPPSAG